METFLSIYGFLQIVTFIWFVFLIIESKCIKKHKKYTFKYWWDEKGLGWLLLGSAFSLILSILSYAFYSILEKINNL